ncbi:MAG: alpha/beta fold hydrolase [Micropruina sp.]
MISALEGFIFEVSDGGPKDGPAVVLLHGFPQDYSCWDEVVPRLQAAGLRTLAPALRGYAPAANPRRRRDYTVDKLVDDLIGLLDAAGIERAHLVGHDWGGLLCWATAAARPDRVASLTVLSTPHPRAMMWAIRHADQARKSWHLLAFQLPWLPELILSKTLIVELIRSGLLVDKAIHYAKRHSSAKALRGPVNYYRAVFLSPRPAKSDQQEISAPTTYVWGRRDRYLGRAAAERTAGFVCGPYSFVEVDGGHWLPENHPDEVADAVLARVLS